MDLEINKIDDHFNKCAQDYDRHFTEDMGMGEFYDEIERQVNICGKPKNILVLGCGTGLEVERIKHECNVTAIDISSGMLEELKKKQLCPQVTLNIICGSYFDIYFEENNFDLVLTTYSLHHFKAEQKISLYNKIYSCLKIGGFFINGDTVCKDKDAENYLLNYAEEIYKREQLPFGTLHIDIPLALDTEISLLTNAGFKDISIERRWNKTTLLKSIK